MNAIGISASPRTQSNTTTLINRCLSRLQQENIETKLITLSGKKIAPCSACMWCRSEDGDGGCVIKDDDFHPIFERMKSADIIVTGSPVYFGSATPQLMSLLDRAGYISRAQGQLFSRKIGGPIAVARRAGQNFTYAQQLYWFTINDMIVAGSTYWNIAFGKGGADVDNDEEGMKTIDRFAENIAWLAYKCHG